MFHLILADSELELIPKEIQKSSIVLDLARKRRKDPKSILLDSNIHYKAMKELKEYERRGRPDIVHLTLLLAQDSVLAHEGLLQTYVHTRNNDVIFIDPTTRLPKSYNRFTGLIESVLLGKETELLRLKRLTLLDLVSKINPKKSVCFSEGGTAVNLLKFVFEIPKDTCFIIGGFPHGDFISPVATISDEIVKIYDTSLNAASVLSELLTTLRYTFIP